MKYTQTNQTSLALILGNVLEFYDFSIFVALMPLIAPVLFPSTDPVVSLTSGYLFMGVGFIARPFGAYVFGSVGDRLGRKKGLLICMGLMAAATASIGFLPSYEQAGLWGYVFLACARWLQGMSAGGEYTGAGLALIEDEKGKGRFTKSSLLSASGFIGAFVATCVAYIVNLKGMPPYAWRFSFILGGVLGLYALWLRLYIPETQAFIQQQKGVSQTYGFNSIIKEFPRPFYQTVMVGAFANMLFYMLFGFLNPYAAILGLFDRSAVMFVNAAVTLLCAVGIGFSGRLTYLHTNPTTRLKYIALTVMVAVVPLFYVALHGSIYTFAFVQFIFVIFISLFGAPIFVVMAEAFPVAFRYRGAAISYMVGNALSAGVAPYVYGYLTQKTGTPLSACAYIILVGVLLFHALHLNEKTAISKAG
jgi:MHS family proline/betaine transporter-like MFS transporter